MSPNALNPNGLFLISPLDTNPSRRRTWLTKAPKLARSMCLYSEATNSVKAFPSLLRNSVV
jgi:hypothetical protein